MNSNPNVKNVGQVNKVPDYISVLNFPQPSNKREVMRNKVSPLTELIISFSVCVPLSCYLKQRKLKPEKSDSSMKEK